MPGTQVVNEGNPRCNHIYIYFVQNGLDGEAWWCDNCERHEQGDYRIKFPSGAFIRTPNPIFGGERVYAYQANKEGIVTEELPIDKRKNREDILHKIAEECQTH